MKVQRRTAQAWVVGVVCAAVLLVAIGGLAPERQMFALAGAFIVFVIGASFGNSMALPLVSMATLVVVERVGGDTLNLTMSDAVLFAAFWVAVIFTPRPFSPPMRAMMWLSFVYQVASLFTVVGNPYRANAVEWVHAWLLVGGAMVVGWAVGRSGYARAGVLLLLGPSVTIAVLVLIRWATAGSSGPVFVEWPWPMHKNFAGCVVGFAAIIAYVRPVWLRLHTWLAIAIFWVCAAAIVAAQARQALIALGVAVVIVCLRKDPDVKRSRLILVPIVPAAIVISTMVQEQLTSDNQFNSAFQRLTWYEQALSVWQASPWYGVGLRWWVAGRTEYLFQPPNAELEVLTSVGIIGLVGFMILMLGGLVLTWRLGPRYGTLGFAVLLSRFVQSQFDLFWISIQVSIPFAVIGLCLGAQAFAAGRAAAEPGSAMPAATESVESDGVQCVETLEPSARVEVAPSPFSSGRAARGVG